jgi:hypothetical protein
VTLFWISFLSICILEIIQLILGLIIFKSKF